jgi:hypothetical protein
MDRLIINLSSFGEMYLNCVYKCLVTVLDRLCGLVASSWQQMQRSRVRFRSATLSDKYWVWNGVHSAS